MTGEGKRTLKEKKTEDIPVGEDKKKKKLKFEKFDKENLWVGDL